MIPSNTNYWLTPRQGHDRGCIKFHYCLHPATNTTYASNLLHPDIQRKMSSEPLPYPLVQKRASEVTQCTLDLHYDYWGRKGAGEGSNSPPILSKQERARVLNYWSQPGTSDDMIEVTWDWLGDTHQWVQKNGLEEFCDPNEAKTPPNDDNLELNGIQMGEAWNGREEWDEPAQENNSRRRSQDIPVATRGDRNFWLTESTNQSYNQLPFENAREPDLPLGSQVSSREANYIRIQQTYNGPRYHLRSHQARAGEERARQLHFYDGTESQGSGYVPSLTRNERLRTWKMADFVQGLRQKLEEHFVDARNAMEHWIGMKVTRFSAMAMCIPILLILRGVMMGYPLMVGMWLGVW